MSFVHLHVHYEYSVLDGLSKIEEILQEVTRLTQPAVAMTDHGVMGGTPDFITMCKKNNIKPIPGCEAYLTQDRRMQSEELKEMRENLCLKYGIITKTKTGKPKPKMKALQDFLKIVRKNWGAFEQEAPEFIKDYLMENPAQSSSSEQLDIFSIEEDVHNEEQNELETFKKDVLHYLDQDNFHIVLLAMNNQGLEDLYEIISDAHVNGFYSDPRTDLAYIRERNLGRNIIATSACLGSYFSRLIMQGRMEEAKQHIQECQETFAHFYLEKQATQIPEQIELNRIIDRLSEETGVPKIVTTDVHYAREDDYDMHDTLVAASMGKCIGDENRYHYSTDHYVKSAEEIRAMMDDEEAIQNTLAIADMVNVSLPTEPLLPQAIVEEGETAEEILRKKAWNGLFQYMLRRPELSYEQYSQQMDFELDIICSMGFADYFLIEEDMINATKEAGFLVGPGRGSAAGSLVAYCIGVTDLDPIENGLLFERFLNPERSGYPDIDVDYSYEGARWVQMYLKEKYGQDKVAQIGTYGTLAARSAIRLIGKTLDYNLTIQDSFAKAIPGKPGTTLRQAHEQEEVVRTYAEQYPDWWEAACKLEGHVRSEGVHAGGIVLSPEKLTKVVPLRTDSEGLETTQYDMSWIEEFLVKFDILKLDTLDLIKKTMEYANIWGKVDINKINLNDPFVYEQVYNTLNTSGVFQVESDGMRDTIKGLKPNNFEDIGVILAMYRPGPMDLIPNYVNRKWGKEKVEYPFPQLEEALGDTFGIFCYQEQIMQSSRIIGGLTRGQSDYGIRKGVAKKKVDLMNRWIDLMIYGTNTYRQKHQELTAQYPDKDEAPSDLWVDYDWNDAKKVPDGVEGGINRGYDEQKLLELKEQWIKFGDYCFNKAHSAAYAKISVQTAHLKAYYPTEFMAALLTMSEGKKDNNNNPKNIRYMQETEDMGISILPPDINKSLADWTPVAENKNIVYGLASVKNISSKDLEKIEAHRPFLDFDDFLDKNDQHMKLNKTKMVNLIKSGAFDSIKSNRNLLLKQYFEWRGDEEDAEKYPTTTTKKTIMAYEQDTLGTVISVQSRWMKLEDGVETQVTGTVRKLEPWTAKSSGKKHYSVTLETNEDTREGLIWGYLVDRAGGEDAIRIGNKVTLKGKKDGDKMVTQQITIVEDIMKDLSQYEVDLEGAG